MDYAEILNIAHKPSKDNGDKTTQRDRQEAATNTAALHAMHTGSLPPSALVAVGH